MDNKILKRRELDKGLDQLYMLLYFQSEIQSNLKFKSDQNFTKTLTNQNRSKDNN